MKIAVFWKRDKGVMSGKVDDALQGGIIITARDTLTLFPVREPVERGPDYELHITRPYKPKKEEEEEEKEFTEVPF